MAIFAINAALRAAAKVLWRGATPMSLTPDAWARITALFDELQPLEAATRQARLDELARTEPAVAAEVASLLEADSDGEFLDADSGGAFRKVVHSSPRLLGQTVGAYRVEREIGRGGMGVVYEGRHIDPSMTKRVAIKTLAIGLDRPELAWRFRRERQILAKLEHPNIAALYDGGTTEDGMPYLVMEYVDGVRIDSWCDRNRLTIPQRLDLFRQVCAAVHFAHSKLIVHRDLKPNNILVNSDGVVKLLDFGIAKLATDDESSGEHSEYTRAGATPLTTAYASPEQVRGDEVTTASDVYSLGVILYRLLTGTSPYATDGKSPAAARDAITATPVRTPSDVVTETQPAQCQLPNVTSLRDTLRGELDAIVLMAMRAEPERRYASAEALSSDLLRFLKGMPVEARPDTMGYRVRKFVRRQRALVGAIGVAVVALSVGTVVAVRAARTARAEADRAQKFAIVMQEVIGAGTTSVSRYKEPPTLLTVLDSARLSVARQFGGDPRTRGDFYYTFGRSYLSFDRADLSAVMLDSAVRLHSAALGDNSLEAAIDLATLADALDVIGQPDSGLVKRQRAVEVLRQARPVPELPLAYAEVALGATMIGQYINEDKGLPIIRAGLDRARRLPKPPWDMIARGEAVSIMPYSRQHGEAAADSAYQRSVEALKRDSSNSEEARTALGFQVAALVTRNRAADAVVPARLLLEKTVERLGPTHYLVAQAQNLLGGALTKANRPAEARVIFDSAIVIAESHFTTDPMYLADMYAGRAMAEVVMHDEPATLRSIGRVKELTATLGAQKPTAEMTIERIMSTLDVDQGRIESARGHLERAVEIGRKAFGPTATRTVGAETRLKDFNAAHPAPAAR